MQYVQTHTHTKPQKLHNFIVVQSMSQRYYPKYLLCKSLLTKYNSIEKKWEEEKKTITSR